MATLAFDIYGTLIDTHGVVVRLREFIGDQAPEFSRVWRDKQLEYSFRRGLMRRYETFAVCTRQALDYTSDYLRAGLSDAQKTILLDAYRVLPAFDDVADALHELRAAGHRLYAFSNGTAEAVETLLQTAAIRDRFDGVVSVDEQQSFKPNPDVYRHMLAVTGAVGDQAWLISSNPFDVIGAAACGLNTGWVQRSDDTVFDPWGIEPTVTIGSLRQLAGVLADS